jgi:hypothetical protein
MILFNKLPDEIESYILWLSVGGKDMDIYKKKKNVNAEINLYKTLKKEYPGGVYLKPIPDYKKIPELESMEYIYIYIYMEPGGYCPSTELQSENTTRNSNISLEGHNISFVSKYIFLIN